MAVSVTVEVAQASFIVRRTSVSGQVSLENEECASVEKVW